MPHQLFERAADRFGDRPAVRCEDRRLTYAETEARANRLARHLRERGVRRGSLVGILLERSESVPIAILAVLKAGAGYVPLDPDYPADRIAGILSDSAAVALVTESGFREKHAGYAGTVIELDSHAHAIASHPADRLSLPLDPTDPAYVIFTSGSTGRPKGVLVEHRSAEHLVKAERELYGLTEAEVVWHGFSVAFDASVEELWAALAHGGELVIGTRAMIQAVNELPTTLSRFGVTFFSTVPTLLAMLEGDLPTVRTLILGGEACPPELVPRWGKPGRILWNTYGPTEATVIATAAKCEPGKPVTIGKPLRGYAVYLLDESLQPVPPGEEGEIVIGGIGVARGYIGRPDLTAEKFLDSPFRTGERLYRTGDIGRWNVDGDLEFRGRRDGQVKLRGFRIELAEIDAALLEHDGVRAAACRVFDADGVRTLVAFVVPKAEVKFAPDAVRKALRSRLPAYMIPAAIETLAELPTLPSGKVDRARLPAPTRAALPETPAVPPETPLEAKLVAVWAALFSRPAVSVTDDFFLDLGGHSMLAARLASRLRAEPGLEAVSVVDVYQHPTVRGLAAHLGRATEPPPPPAAPRAPVPRLRHFLCGLGQLLFLYPILAVVSLQWVGPYLVYASLIADDWPTVPAAAVAVLSLSVIFPALLVLGVAAKWLLLGQVKPGWYPLWGWFYLRWWTARAILSVVPTRYLVGTPWLGRYARLLGAKVGRNVYLGTDALFPFDLLEIGDDAAVGSDVSLRGCRVEGGWLIVDRISVGAGAVVGNRSLIQAGGRIEAGGKLDELSFLSGKQIVPAGETWAGSPAVPAGSFHSPPPRRPSIGRSLVLNSLYALGAFLLPVVAILAFLPAVIGLNALGHATSGYWYLLAAPLGAVSFVVSFALLLAAVKWALLGRVKAGTYPRHGFFQFRRWFVDRLAEMSLDVTGTLYATIYLNPWYRLMGAKVGRMAEVSTATAVNHDLLTLGPESFLADAVTVGAAQVDANTVTLGPVTVGAKAFAGNGAHLPPGGLLGDDALLGCQSLLPPAAIQKSSGWVGSPAFFLPQRESSTQFPDHALTKPTRKLWLLRGFIEFFRVTLPATALLVLTSLLISATVALDDDWPLAAVLAVFPLLYALAGITAALFVVLLKWIVIGRYRPTERPLWSSFVWRTELVTGLREHLADFYLVALLRGTPFLPWFFRLMGARIGRRVYLDTTDLCEHDLTTLGDEAELNDECTLQTHLFEDRVMKVSSVDVGAGATVGAWTLVLYDTVIEPNAVIGELSLLMKGERLPAGTRWAGIPARADGG